MAPKTAHMTDARRALIVAASILALTLSGCAGGAAESDPPPTDTETTAPADGGDAGDEDSDRDAGDEGDSDAGDGGEVASLGTITIGTTIYQVVESINCELRESDLATPVIDMIAIGISSAGEEALFFAYTDEINGVADSYVDYQGPEGTYSSNPGAATFTYSDGIVNGASTIIDEAETETLMAQFRFELPAELQEC